MWTVATVVLRIMRRNLAMQLFEGSDLIKVDGKVFEKRSVEETRGSDSWKSGGFPFPHVAPLALKPEV